MHNRSPSPPAPPRPDFASTNARRTALVVHDPGAMMPERSRAVARLAALVLLALGAWRIAVIVAASPMLGYANQFDMGRTSACFGLWPDLPEPARYEAHPQAPIARYVRGEQRPAECYRSSELAFVAAALAIAPRDGPVDLRIVGAVKGAVLILVALGLDAALKRRPAWALANAAVFAIVLADPMMTLWLNTLYTEFGALVGAYASIGLLPALIVRDPERSQSPPRWALAGLRLSASPSWACRDSSICCCRRCSRCRR